ncbi:MAG TPA: hypothetical protein VFS49_00330, partial [Croceibacterium sp.]|nr:hypothetical protein [Croceibacterium sp.]
MATVSASAPGASSRHDVLQRWPGRANRAASQRTQVIRRVLHEFVSFAGCRKLTLTAVLVVVGTAVEGVGILLVVPLLRAFLGQGAAPAPADGWPFERLLEPLAPATQLAILFAGFLALMLLRALALIARDTQLARLQLGFVATIK